MSKPFLSKLYKLIPITTVAVLAGCATTPTPVVDYKPDYDFSKARTLAFYDDSGLVTGNNPVPLSDMEHERIDTALETALRNKGLTVLEKTNAPQAQLLISWTLVRNDKTDVRTYETPTAGMAYSRYGGYNRYSLYNCWGCTRTEVSVKNYTEGTFIVDMIDPKLKRSVWRGEIQSRLKGQLSQDQDKYNAAAELILTAFPPN